MQHYKVQSWLIFFAEASQNGSGSHSPHNELLRIAMEIIDGYLLLCRAYQLAVVSVHQSTCDDEDMHNEIPYRLRWFMVQSSNLISILCSILLGLLSFYKVTIVRVHAAQPKITLVALPWG